MRTRHFQFAFALMGTFALTACGEGSLSNDKDGQAGDAASRLENVALVLLDDGLQLNDDAQTTFEFGADQSQVRAALDPVLGEPLDVFEQPRCEPGTLTLTEYSGRLTVNMMDGKLVGWFVDMQGDPKYATPEGVRVGTPRDALEDAYFIIRSGTSPFGAEYSTVGGYVFSVAASLEPGSDGQGQQVHTMDAGEVCFR